jgi:hypothetical protein
VSPPAEIHPFVGQGDLAAVLIDERLANPDF